MRFVVDECTGPTVSAWLHQQGHDVFCVYTNARGADDDALLERANQEDRILMTADKDFGDLIFRDQRPHHGVVLLRHHNPSPANFIQAIETLLNANLPMRDHFNVLSEAGIRTH